MVYPVYRVNAVPPVRSTDILCAPLKHRQVDGNSKAPNPRNMDPPGLLTRGWDKNYSHKEGYRAFGDSVSGARATESGYTVFVPLEMCGSGDGA